MKLLILSDLHLDESNDWNFINKITNEMTRRVNNKRLKDEELLIVILGDIIHRGGNGNITIKFSEADKFINKLKDAFNDVKLLFIPGNHEIEKNSFDLNGFNAFYQRHSFKKDFVFTMDNSIFSFETAKINLLLVDSTLTRNHDLDGKINLEELKAKMSPGKNLIFMHHPPCQQEGADRSIINENELMATYSNFIFYGHQHGYVKVPDFLKNDTDIHSVGTFLREDKGSSIEFVLLDIADGRINFAYRYIWSGVKFVAHLLFPFKENLMSDSLPLSTPHKNHTKVMRKLKKMGAAQNSKELDSLFHTYIGEDIDEVVRKHNLVFLLGDAGTGKSFELANIYWHYENDNEYFPIWINLRNTSHSDVEYYTNIAKQKTVDRKTPFLILDGLDEMDGGKIDSLIKMLGSATYGNTEVRIILSARTNFRVSIDKQFSEYIMLPLSSEQIVEIAQNNAIINATKFLKCIEGVDCLTLAQTPFYLFDMIQIYRETGCLPKREFLLDKMISFRLKKGDERHPCAYKDMLMANEYELRSRLKELSFSIQALHLFSLSNIDYTRMFSSTVRGLFNKTGLLVSKESDHTLTWEFEHNIFREYFVAEYLTDIPFDILLGIITYDQDTKLLRPSWMNVLSFMLPMQKSDALSRWLVENAPETIYKFESDRFTANDRNKIFEYLMQDSFAKNIPVYALHEEERLAKFFQSEVSLQFLLKTIINPASESCYLGAISVLRYFDDFYGKEAELKCAIIPYVDAKQPEYVVSFAVKALLKIFREDLLSLTTELYVLLKDDERPEVRGALCQLFNKTNAADDYSEYLLNAFDTYPKLQENHSAWKEFSEAIKSFNSPSNILEAINILCSDRSHRFYNADEMFEELVSKIFEINRTLNNALLNDLVGVFVCVASKCDRRKSIFIKKLFCGYDVLENAFVLMLGLKINEIGMMFSIEDIMEDSLLDLLISSYKNDEVDAETYKWYIRRCSDNPSRLERLNQAVLEKEGAGIVVEEREDWQKTNLEGNQRYFNCLFDKAKFAELIGELLTFFNDDILCEELLGNDFNEVPHNRQDIWEIQAAIYHNKSAGLKVNNFLDNIGWNEFAIIEMCRMLKNSEQIKVSPTQKNHLETYFNKTLASINFEELKQTELYIATRIILLKEKLNFEISDKKLLEMLMLPWNAFVSSTSSGDSESLNFVIKNIFDKSALKERIIYNIRNKTLGPSAAQAHILYCANESLPDGVDIAIALFKNVSEEAKWYKNCAADYLISIKGEKFVDNLVDETTDDNFLRYLACIIRNENDRIVQEMIDRNSKSNDHMLFLPDLLKLNCRCALETYYELAKSVNTLPDFLPEELHIGPITMAIREINDITLIDIVSELIKLCYAEGFKDKESFGLRGNLNTVINNLIQKDKFKVKEMLENIIAESAGDNGLVSTCNWHLTDIYRLINISSDLPWSMEETLAFLKQQKADR